MTLPILLAVYLFARLVAMANKVRRDRRKLTDRERYELLPGRRE